MWKYVWLMPRFCYVVCWCYCGPQPPTFWNIKRLRDEKQDQATTAILPVISRPYFLLSRKPGNVQTFMKNTEALLRFERRIIRILIIYYLERRPCILGPSGIYSAYFYLNRNHSNFCNSFCQTVVCLDWIFNGKENSFRILFVNNSSFFVEVYKKFIHSICLKSFLVHIILQTHV